MDNTEDMAVRVSALLDIVFKYIFGSPESEPILTALINAVQKDSSFPEIESVEIKNPFNDKTYQDDKLSIIDVRAQAVSGEWYNIEVQLQNQQWFPERSLYYWANAYSRQLQEGKEYEKLNKVISINFLNFVLLDDPVPFHSCFLIQEKDYPECVLTEDLIIHYLEIPKMEEVLETDLQKWVYFLRHAGEEDEKMKVLLKTNETLEEAARRHKQFTENEQGWMAAQARSMFLHDQASKLADARREGEQKGETAKAREDASRMLEKGYPIEDICDITGLTRNEVEALRES